MTVLNEWALSQNPISAKDAKELYDAVNGGDGGGITEDRVNELIDESLIPIDNQLSMIPNPFPDYPLFSWLQHDYDSVFNMVQDLKNWIYSIGFLTYSGFVSGTVGNIIQLASRQSISHVLPDNDSTTTDKSLTISKSSTDVAVTIESNGTMDFIIGGDMPSNYYLCMSDKYGGITKFEYGTPLIPTPLYDGLTDWFEHLTIFGINGLAFKCDLDIIYTVNEPQQITISQTISRYGI